MRADMYLDVMASIPSTNTRICSHRAPCAMVCVQRQSRVALSSRPLPIPAKLKIPCNVHPRTELKSAHAITQAVCQHTCGSGNIMQHCKHHATLHSWGQHPALHPCTHLHHARVHLQQGQVVQEGVGRDHVAHVRREAQLQVGQLQVWQGKSGKTGVFSGEQEAASRKVSSWEGWVQRHWHLPGGICACTHLLVCTVNGQLLVVVE